jgi:hypothetical protein
VAGMSGAIPISTAFYVAVAALAAANGAPLPAGISEAVVGDWKLAVNNGKEALPYNGQSLEPFTVYAENTVYIGFALFDAHEGLFGGIPEDQFIADMKEAGFSDPGAS